MTMRDDDRIDEQLLRAAMGDEDPAFLDDPDRSDRPGPAPTEPGIQSLGDTVLCPWCGEELDLFLEPSGEASVEEFVEECPACTRDFEVRVEYDNAGAPHVSVRREGG
jgi:cysteine-rich CPXCG protein